MQVLPVLLPESALHFADMSFPAVSGNTSGRPVYVYNRMRLLTDIRPLESSADVSYPYKGFFDSPVVGQ